MKVTPEFIRDCFRRFNAEMFEGRLPSIPIQIRAAKTYLGRFRYVRKKNLLGKVCYRDMSLCFSSLFDLSREEWEDTVIHEMIHYSLAVAKAPEETPHGPHFRAEMERINREFGRNITIRHKKDKDKPDELTDTRRRIHILAVLRMKDGQTGLKCLVRIEDKIAAFYNAATQISTVDHVELYCTDDYYFNRFPHSAALRYHLVDADELSRHLSGAMILNCNGTRVHTGDIVP